MKPTTEDEALRRISEIKGEVNELEAFIKKSRNPKPITERCTSIRAAFEIDGQDYDKFMRACISLNLPDICISAYEISMFAKVLNEGWDPDYGNSNEAKYYPYFDMSSGFSFNNVFYTLTLSDSAARHVFKTEALACFAGCTIMGHYRVFYKN